jgi:uncharacterized YccA/Bax inhibitor family protein
MYRHEQKPTAEGRRATTLDKVIVYGGAVLSAIFLVVSIISWNVWLGACALLLAVLLSKRVDVFTGADARPGAGKTAHPASPGTTDRT